jgi:hypothetical protein
MQTYIPKNTEFFHLSAADFLTAGEGDWRAELIAEKVTSSPEDDDHEEERQQEAESLEGWYWWTCCSGCLPDSDASGPFETEEEAIQDAGGGEYEDYVIALAEELGEDPAEITKESHDCYGLTVLSHGRAEYAIGTDEEADEAWDQALDSYLDECGVLDSIPEHLRSYFDRDAWKRDARYAWKRDARYDGRGHALSFYDGNEIELQDGFVAFRIN